jgi:branched-chain amino acid transport system permease protein
VYAKLGHDLVERVDGHETVATAFETDTLDAEIYEQLGQQVLHAGGPATAPGQAAFADLSERFAKEEILPRIDDDLVAEHEANPIGQHSDDLQRVLHYFRRQPNEGKYVVVETERSEEWAIGELSGKRTEAPEILDDRFSSVEAAEHEIFRRRVEEFRETFGAE